MTALPPKHRWLVTGPGASAGEPLPSGSTMLDITCHRRLRGPYTGGGALLRRVIPELVEHPELIAARANEVVSLTPELIDLVPIPPQTLTMLADRAERTRFYPVARTLRLAHGIAELLMDWVNTCHPEGVRIAFRQMSEADFTDIELVTVLLRRCDPRLVTLLVSDCDQPADEGLARALSDNAERVTYPPAEAVGWPAGTDLAQAFIDTDGIIADPVLMQAYQALNAEDRRARHLARAQTLSTEGEPGAQLGAVPYHLAEAGSAEAAEGGLVAAVEECFDRGFYQATLEWALRGREVVNSDSTAYWNLTNKVGACLSYLGRGTEAFAYFDEMRRRSIRAEVHMNTAYNLAMLFTRHLPRHMHDEDRALEWANTAIAFADRHPDPHQKVFFGAFMRNAKALVELHRADLPAAMALVNEAIGMTDSDLGPAEQLLHRSVLLYNRAQILAALGDTDGALDDYDEVIHRDPDYGDYYFERAGVRRVAGRHLDALADYAKAIQLSPPFYEAYVNRSDLLRELGDEEAALADLDYVLTLQPEHLDSLVNRADLLLGQGDWERAAADISRGLAIDPDNASLLTARGAMLAEQGDVDGAFASYTAALQSDSDYAPAWANRAVLCYSDGRLGAAVSDLDQALALTDSAELRANRGIALQELGRHREALTDFDIALADGPDSDVLYRRGLSRLELSDVEGARADWQQHLVLAGLDSPYAETIRQHGVTSADLTGSIA